MSELGDRIEYSGIARLKLAGKVLARTNNYHPNYHHRLLILSSVSSLLLLLPSLQPIIAFHMFLL